MVPATLEVVKIVRNMRILISSERTAEPRHEIIPMGLRELKV